MRVWRIGPEGAEEEGREEVERERQKGKERLASEREGQAEFKGNNRGGLRR